MEEERISIMQDIIILPEKSLTKSSRDFEDVNVMRFTIIRQIRYHKKVHKFI